VTISPEQLAKFGQGVSAGPSPSERKALVERDKLKRDPSIPIPTYQFGFDQGMGAPLSRVPNGATGGRPVGGFWGPQV
jgi:hypothetical protein